MLSVISICGNHFLFLNQILRSSGLCSELKSFDCNSLVSAFCWLGRNSYMDNTNHWNGYSIIWFHLSHPDFWTFGLIFSLLNWALSSTFYIVNIQLFSCQLLEEKITIQNVWMFQQSDQTFFFFWSLSMNMGL